jgi:ribosome-associated protein
MKIAIPESELSFFSARSSGPGGQNVNKVETRVSVVFDFQNSAILSERQILRLERHPKIQRRLDSRGRIVISSQVHRSQGTNKREVIDKLCRLVAECLQPQKPRRATKPSKASKVKRKDEKRRRGELKNLRRTMKTNGD